MADMKQKSTKASKNIEETMSRGRRRNWGRIKSEIWRIHFQENKTLDEAVPIIERLYGFKVSRRMWYVKFKEWNFGKNKPRRGRESNPTQRKRPAIKGIEVSSPHRQIPIAEEKLERNMSSGISGIESSLPTPSYLTYGLLENMAGIETRLEDTCDFVSLKLSSPGRRAEASRYDVDDRFHSIAVIEGPTDVVSDLRQILFPYSIERFLSGKHQHWSFYHLRHQQGDHGAVLAKQRDLFQEVDEIEPLANASIDQEEPRPPILHVKGSELDAVGIIDLFHISDPKSKRDSKRDSKEYPSEVACFEETFAPTLNNTELQHSCRKYIASMHGLDLNVATTAQRLGTTKHGEHYCRKIIEAQRQGSEPALIFQTFLGMVLAKTGRLEDIIPLLFVSIAQFIVDFNTTDMDENAIIITCIDALLEESLHIGTVPVESWPILQSCLSEMAIACQESMSEGTCGRILPRFLVSGLEVVSKVHFLSATDSARFIYGKLLEHSYHVDPYLYGFEMAEAHRTYGFILRRQEKLMKSAEQLYLACKFARRAGYVTKRLIKKLGEDFRIIVAAGFHRGTSEVLPLMEKIRHSLTLCEARQLPIRQTLKNAHPLRIANPLSTPILCLQSLSISKVANGHGEEGAESDNRSMTASGSASDSHKYGIGYANSEVTYVSDSALFTSFLPHG